MNNKLLQAIKNRLTRGCFGMLDDNGDCNDEKIHKIALDIMELVENYG